MLSAALTGNNNAASPFTGEAPSSLRLIAAFFKRDFAVFRSYRMAMLMEVFSVLFVIPMFYYMGKLIGDAHPEAMAKYNNDYFGFLILGSGLLNIFTVTSYTQSQSLRTAQMLGTLEAILMGRASISSVMIASSAFPVVHSVVLFILKVFFSALFFGLNVSDADWLSAALLLVFCLITYAAIGLFMAAFVLVMKLGDPLSGFLNYATLLLGGVYFPVEYLHPWLKKLGYLIPATHAIEGAREAILTGRNVFQMGDIFLGLALLALFLYPLGLFALCKAFNYARKRGTLGSY